LPRALPCSAPSSPSRNANPASPRDTGNKKAGLRLLRYPVYGGLLISTD